MEQMEQTVQLNIGDVRLIALYTGDKGYAHCACKCPCCSQKGVGGNYQGDISQVEELLERFTGLEQLYFFGNPDPVIDPEFCNQASKLAIERGINVCYSTSGIGGVTTLERLLKGIPPEKVDYISFSIDSVDAEKMKMLKGVAYPWERAIEGIVWAISNGYTVKIQPTLWSSNYMDAYSIIDYFARMGVERFSFHVGSVETNNLETHQHLTPLQIRAVHEQIDLATAEHNVHVECPIIYPECGENNVHKWYCMNPQECYNWLVFLRKDGVFATHVPIMSEFDERFCFDITKPISVAKVARGDSCPLSASTAKRKTLCRYIAKVWKQKP